MRFIYIVGGKELVVSSGLARLMPKWLGDREDLITVGGSKSRDPNSWRDSPNEAFSNEIRKIVATVVEILVNTVMSTHVYTFMGRHFLQTDGGPIGLRCTASLASLVMKLWEYSV